MQQVVAVEPGVEPEEADVGAGVQRAGFSGRVDTDAQGSVHGYGNCNQVGAGRSAGREVFHGQVGRGSVKASRAEGGQRPGQAKGLMTEFVAGEQQN